MSIRTAFSGYLPGLLVLASVAVTAGPAMAERVNNVAPDGRLLGYSETQGNQTTYYTPQARRVEIDRVLPNGTVQRQTPAGYTLGYIKPVGH